MSGGPGSILFRMPNWLGDAVMALPAIGGIMAAFPGTKIDLLFRAPFGPLGELADGVRFTWELDRANPRRILAVVADQKYDAAVILPNSFRSAWELRGARIPRRIGYGGNLRSWLLTDAISRPRRTEGHQCDYYFRLVQAAFPGVEERMPELVVPAAARHAIDELLGPVERPLIGIGFGASYGSAKMWPAERFARLADRLADEFDVLLVGGPGDAEVAERVLAACGSSPRSLVGRTDLPMLAALMTRMAAYVTNDTGPMHLAAWAGTPVVALFGPTSPEETAPRTGRTRLLYASPECGPCWERTCPTDHCCMTALTVDAAEEAVRALVRAG